MSEEEFKDFVRQLYGTFPGLKEWVLKNAGDDVVITHRAWYTTLRSCTKLECMSVLAGWLNGKFPVFAAYERDKIALVIRAIVHGERAKASRFNHADASREEYVKTKRGDYVPVTAGSPGLSQKLAEGRALMKRLKDGEITDHEFVVQKRQLIDSIV